MYNKLEFIACALVSVIWLMVESLIRKILTLLSIIPKTTTLKAEKIRENLIGQIAIVTGSNTGIGKCTALALARNGATVILACRDNERGKEAVNEINLLLKSPHSSSTEYPHALKGKARFIKLDLSDLHSILTFVRSFKEEFVRLDILVNNAGLNMDGVLSNGLQQLFQVNYLGHYLLYRALEDSLTSTVGLTSSNTSTNTNGTFPAARVINLSSVMHHSGQGNFKISSIRKYPSIMRWLGNNSYYDDSKFYMNVFTMEINQRNDELQQKQSSKTSSEVNPPGSRSPRPGNKQSNENNKREIIAISVNPGAVASDIWRDYPLLPLFNFFTSFVFLPVNDGAKTSIYACLIQEALLKEYRQNPNHMNGEIGGKLQFYRDVPYFMPYRMYWTSLTFELLGVAVNTPRFSPVSFPQQSNDFFENQIDPSLQVPFKSPRELSKELWKYSAQLSERILMQSGVAKERLQFLQ